MRLARPSKISLQLHRNQNSHGKGSRIPRSRVQQGFFWAQLDGCVPPPQSSRCPFVLAVTCTACTRTSTMPLDRHRNCRMSGEELMERGLEIWHVMERTTHRPFSPVQGCLCWPRPASLCVIVRVRPPQDRYWYKAPVIREKQLRYVARAFFVG